MKPESTIVPLHESTAPIVTPGSKITDCVGIRFDDGREVSAGIVQDPIGGLAVRIRRPLEDGTVSDLSFALSWEASRALHDVLCKLIVNHAPKP